MNVKLLHHDDGKGNWHSHVCKVIILDELFDTELVISANDNSKISAAKCLVGKLGIIKKEINELFDKIDNMTLGEFIEVDCFDKPIGNSSDVYYVHWQGDSDYYYDQDSSNYVFEGTRSECEDWITRARIFES